MPMSEETGGKHGPAEDDAIKRQDRTEVQDQDEEWPGPVSPDDPDAIWAEEGRFAGTPPDEDWEGVELRSDLARQLNRTDFPVTRASLLEILNRNLADQRLLDRASELPEDRRFDSLADLLPGMGLPVEHRG
jgi:Protein of unknown function (DUF2795)